MNRYGGFNGRYQLGGDFFNYFKGIYPNILGYQGQSGGQSNLYSDDAQEYYKDLINRNSAYDNYTNKDAYFQDNPYDPLGGVQIGNWQSQGIPGFYEAMNTNFDQQQSRIDDFVDKDAKWADKIAASMQADLNTRRDEWDNKTGKIFNEAKTNQIMETGANIFSLMRGQEEYDNALKEDPLTLTNTGFKGFKYQRGGNHYDVSKIAPRNGVRRNKDGSVSSHLMSYGESDGSYYAFPTLFQDSIKGWYQGDFNEAKRRKELFKFATEAEAKNFAEGAWKNPKMQLGGSTFGNLVNTTGYTRGTNTFNNPFNIIPGGNITMKQVDEPILATPSIGKPVIMEPGKDYNFPGASYVVEQRLNNYKHGGKMKNYKYGGKMKYQKGGEHTSYKKALYKILDSDDGNMLYHRGYFGYPETLDPDTKYKKIYKKEGIKGLKAALRREGHGYYRKESGDNSLSAQFNTLKYAMQDILPQFQLGGIKGNVQQGMFNNRFKYAELPTINQGPMNPFVSSPDTRSIMKNINGTFPTGTAIPLSNQSIQQLPQIASYIDFLYADAVMDGKKKDAAIKAKMKLADPTSKNPFNTKEDGTKDKRVGKHYVGKNDSVYKKAADSFGFMTKEDVKNFQREQNKRGYNLKVDGIVGKNTFKAMAASYFNAPEVNAPVVVSNSAGYGQGMGPNMFKYGGQVTLKNPFE